MMGQDNIDLDEAAINALQEAFSQVSGPVLTALGERVGGTVMSDPPDGGLVSGPDIGFPPGQYVRVRYNVTIEGQAPVSYVEVFDSQAVSAVLGAGEMSGGGMGGGMSQPAAQNQGQMFGQPNAMQQQPMMSQSGTQQGGQPPANQANVQSVQFPGLSPGGPPTEQGNIGLLMDVYMEMTVELGRTRRLIKEILGMGEGTIIELDKLAGEPVDILVNHKLIAKGEVVVIDENFGVRVTEIVSPLERVSDVG
jgi:flagellar motor switch protein FliN/FliY